MEQRTIGKTGIRASAVGLGCNNFGWTIDEDASRSVIHRALDQGITLFDTSDKYGDGASEEIMGRAFKGRRDKAVIVTKFGVMMPGYFDYRNTSRGYVLTAVENSLRRLQTDYIDVYMLHWPDPSTPMEETLRALDDLITQGKVRYIAASNLRAWEMVEASWISKTQGYHRFIASQNEYSLLARGVEADFPALEAYGIGLLPYFPLASGMLTGKYKRGADTAEDSRMTRLPAMKGKYATERNFDIVEKLQAFVDARGHTLLELAFSWLLTRPIVSSVIAGATRPDQIDANIAAAGWKLTPDEIAEVDALTKGA